MKTMLKNGKVGRFTDEEAERLKNQGWEFTPKATWKVSKPIEKSSFRKAPKPRDIITS